MADHRRSGDARVTAHHGAAANEDRTFPRIEQGERIDARAVEHGDVLPAFEDGGAVDVAAVVTARLEAGEIAGEQAVRRAQHVPRIAQKFARVLDTRQRRGGGAPARPVDRRLPRVVTRIRREVVCPRRAELQGNRLVVVVERGLTGTPEELLLQRLGHHAREHDDDLRGACRLGGIDQHGERRMHRHVGDVALTRRDDRTHHERARLAVPRGEQAVPHAERAGHHAVRGA